MPPTGRLRRWACCGSRTSTRENYEVYARFRDLYGGHEVSEDGQARLLSLFHLEIRDPELVRPDVRGRPVYLGMSQNAERELTLKPQKILVNLPLVEAA